MRISDWSSDVCSSDRDVAALQGLDRQQAVVDRAERGAGADDDGDLPSGEQVGVEGGGRYRNERAAGTFADQVAGRRRTAERRVGNESVGTCRSRWAAYH